MMSHHVATMLPTIGDRSALINDGPRKVKRIERFRADSLLDYILVWRSLISGTTNYHVSKTVSQLRRYKTCVRY